MRYILLRADRFVLQAGFHILGFYVWPDRCREILSDMIRTSYREVYRSSKVDLNILSNMTNEVMSDKQMINRKPWLPLEFASPGVISRSKDSK